MTFEVRAWRKVVYLAIKILRMFILLFAAYVLVESSKPVVQQVEVQMI